MHLFESVPLRGLTARNRIVVSPMCQYSSQDGFANDWHLVHLGSFALGGAGIVVSEAAAVEPRGRISPHDLGIWKDEHIEPLARVTGFIREQGSIPAIQLAHAGRKASMRRSWDGGGIAPAEEGGWQPIAPSGIPFADDYLTPTALDEAGIRQVIDEFVAAAQRSLAAGFQIIEIHAAHGYLLHEFLSPLSNHRHDRYGAAPNPTESFDNRTRLLRELVKETRLALPDGVPLFVRISATDWAPGGWDLPQSIQLATHLKELGVDLVDCSSGGLVPGVQLPLGPGYQTAFAAQIRAQAGIPTGAVGMITSAAQADHLVRTEQADFVFLGRELLRDPHWPLRAAHELGQAGSWPIQYQRAKL
jgi:2,4-dienoyl-CoA reductase-like NADH-dependent reductase (Old Yellow Enzyme family)